MCCQIENFLPKKIKIGHAGTLDSFATGLLIVAIDRSATRHIDKLMSLDKMYIAQGKLGQLTDTLDFTGKLMDVPRPSRDEATGQYHVNNGVTKHMLQDAITSFGERYVQIPPIYSALKYKGWALSELLRKQKISDIRVLINDIAEKVGTVATTQALRRLSIG
ncbi:hypothetical protein KC460_02380 [Candidatus Dependentiae bacterium]|nr:hypothetical protein [Candidatus Dependentiae bacterium]